MTSQPGPVPGISSALGTPGAVSQAVSSGSRLDVLLALRLHLADTIDAGTSPRDLATLTLRLSDIDVEVRKIQRESDPVAAARDAAPPTPWTPDE